MANKDPKNLIKDEHVEDVTQYGEFISSFDQWTTFENQQRTAHHLENCTKTEPKRSVRK